MKERDSDAGLEGYVADVAVVGAGFTGLAAAHELAKLGHRVVVFEAEPTVGGLGGSFDVGGRMLERFYHHWFSSDSEITGLCEELGIADIVTEHESRTGLYYANSIYRLSRPLDVLRFAPLPPLDRIRLGLLALKAKRVRHWRELESMTAEEWLIRLGGRRVYETVWRPLLEGKFGQYAAEVGATWMWTKLNLRGGSRNKAGREVLYYLHGGCSALLEAWQRRLGELGVRIVTGCEVQEILSSDNGVVGVRTSKGDLAVNRVLATAAPSIVAGLLTDESRAHPAVHAVRRQLGRIRYLANICLVLENDRPLSDTYWLNVTDPSFPYVGVIEHTNLDDVRNYGGRHVVYLSKYLPTSADLYRMPDEEVFRFSLPHLKKMFPGFQERWVQDFHVWRADHAQPVITPEYSRLIPAMQAEVPGLYLSSMAQIYPEDRGTNYAIRHGRSAGKLIADHLRTTPARHSPAEPAGASHA
ncbi:NAD(P)/FAD-dependent oxidoreductase [Amycolatopsis sp. NPDC059021]|uniref:NAD(P)/FAD-dependent oxidoreductase n=1 Tax=Amycolatopsis sp. NPDC059021 TaxID=3346704 RepID=UPI00366D2F09